MGHEAGAAAPFPFFLVFLLGHRGIPQSCGAARSVCWNKKWSEKPSGRVAWLYPAFLASLRPSWVFLQPGRCSCESTTAPLYCGEIGMMINTIPVEILRKPTHECIRARMLLGCTPGCCSQCSNYCGRINPAERRNGMLCWEFLSPAFQVCLCSLAVWFSRGIDRAQGGLP